MLGEYRFSKDFLMEYYVYSVPLGLASTLALFAGIVGLRNLTRVRDTALRKRMIRLNLSPREVSEHKSRKGKAKPGSRSTNS